MFADLASPLEIRRAEHFFLPPPFPREPIDDFFSYISSLLEPKHSSPLPERKAKRPRLNTLSLRTVRGGVESEMCLRLKEAEETSDVHAALRERSRRDSFLREYHFLVAHKLSKFSSASYLILLAQNRKTKCSLSLYPITLSREHASFDSTLDACLDKLRGKHSLLSRGKGLCIPRSLDSIEPSSCQKISKDQKE